MEEKYQIHPPKKTQNKADLLLLIIESENVLLAIF